MGASSAAIKDRSGSIAIVALARTPVLRLALLVLGLGPAILFALSARQGARPSGDWCRYDCTSFLPPLPAELSSRGRQGRTHICI